MKPDTPTTGTGCQRADAHAPHAHYLAGILVRCPGITPEPDAERAAHYDTVIDALAGAAS